MDSEMNKSTIKVNNKPKMVKVNWKARVNDDDVPSYWRHCSHQIWWVIGCQHIDEPIMKRSSRINGPIAVACWECK